MRKPLVWAVALVLSLAGLMAGMPVLTQAPSSAQIDRLDPGSLGDRTRSGGTWTDPGDHMRGELASDGEARGYELDAESCYNSSDTDVHFPSANTWINSPITIGCAPPGASVTSVDVMVNIVHECPQATKVELRYGGRTLVLWNREGICGDVSFFVPSKNDVTAFNGLPANGTWQAYAVDEVGYGSQYYIDHWNITVEYDSAGPTATPTATAGPTLTPTPTVPPFVGCENILSNGSFESGIVSPWWTTGAARADNQYAHDGTRSVLLVEANDQEGDLIGRLVLPEGADSVTLRYWWRVETQDPEAYSDVMDILVEPGEASYHVAHHSGVDDPGRWNLGEVDLSGLGGGNTFIIFQGRNGPTHPSRWYVDDVEVEVCGEGWGGYKLFVPLVVKGG